MYSFTLSQNLSDDGKRIVPRQSVPPFLFAYSYYSQNLCRWHRKVIICGNICTQFTLLFHFMQVLRFRLLFLLICCHYATGI